MRFGIQLKNPTQIRHKRGKETIFDRRRDYAIGSHSEDDINFLKKLPGACPLNQTSLEPQV